MELTLDLLRLANDILYWLQWVHRAPPGFHWVGAEGFVINEYYTPLETEFSGKKTDTAVGLEGKGSFKEDFLYEMAGVVGQGTGVAEDGTVIGTASNPTDNWSDDWVIKDRAQVQFFVKGKAPENLPAEWSRIAVNPRTGVIPVGARVYIPALDVQLGDHDGFVKASDTSNALLSNEIDLYAGVGRGSMRGLPAFNDDGNYTLYFLARD